MTWPAIPTRGAAACVLAQLAKKVQGSVPPGEPVPTAYIPKAALDKLDTWDKFSDAVERVCQEIHWNQSDWGKLKVPRAKKGAKPNS